MVKAQPQISAFIERLPVRPYCTDDPAQGLLIRPQATALVYRHIQHNPPPHVSCLVFDVDKKSHERCRRDGYHEWRDRGLPAPHWISINPENGNYHLGYLLAAPVARTNAARLKPLRYLAVIEHVLAHRLGADVGYVGLLTKNPTHDDWWTVWHSIEPYSLDYLAEFCPDKDLAAYSRRSRKEVSGLGRNVALFDNVREWAYSAVREYWRPNGYEVWAKAVHATCDSANAFGLEQGGPLPPNEIKATAKSIARWVWRHFTPAKFSAVQAVRGAKGGKVSKGGGRPRGSGRAAELLPVVLQLKAQGYSNRDIAEDLGIGSASVRGRFRIRNLKYVKECEPQQRQGFAQAPHLWKPHFRDSRNSAVSAVQYESGFRESNMPYQHCRGSDSHWSLSKTIVCERDHRANRLPYFKFRILKRPLNHVCHRA